MAKMIRYQFVSHTVNRGTEDQPDLEQILVSKSFGCPTQASFDANYPIALAEAVGEITVEGEFDPPTPDLWDELDAAYRKGVDSL